MTGQITIDGVNIKTEYGLVLADGSYNGIAELPKLKDPDKNDWKESDGIEVDLSKPVLDAKQIELKIVSISNTSNIGGLFVLLSDGAFHTFNFIDLGIQRSLRLLQQSGNSGTFQKLREIRLQFSDDNPMNGYTYQAPIPGLISQSGYSMDGVPFSNYGVIITDGSDEEILRQPDIKQGLTIENSITNGVIYDGGETVTYQAKDVQLKCVMLARDITEFNRNRSALLYDLIRPGLRSLYFGATTKTYDFYYKATNTRRLTTYKTAGIWWEFTITICMTDYRSKTEA